jgi:hypothetical protein
MDEALAIRFVSPSRTSHQLLQGRTATAGLAEESLLLFPTFLARGCESYPFRAVQ